MAVGRPEEDPWLHADGVEDGGEGAGEASEAFANGEGESAPGMQDIDAVTEDSDGNLLVEGGTQQGTEDILIAPKVRGFLF